MEAIDGARSTDSDEPGGMSGIPDPDPEATERTDAWRTDCC